MVYNRTVWVLRNIPCIYKLYLPVLLEKFFFWYVFEVVSRYLLVPTLSKALVLVKDHHSESK